MFFKDKMSNYFFKYNLIKIKKKRIISLLLMSLAISSFGVAANSVYNISVIVNSRNKTDFNKAIATGLQQVFRKLSNDKNLHLLNNIEQPKDFLSSYSYIQEIKEEHKVWRVDVTYDKERINEFLRIKDVPFLSSMRPLTLVLIRVSTKKNSVFLGQNSQDNQLLLSQAMDKYGLPVIYPIMDLSDIEILSDHLLLQQCKDKKIIKLSERYYADAILCGEVQELFNEDWFGDFSIKMNDTNSSLSVESRSFADLVLQISHLYKEEVFANIFEKAHDQSVESLKIKLDNIVSAIDYLKAKRFLARLPGVQQVELSGLDKNNLRYNLNFIGNREQFLKNIQASRHFGLREREGKFIELPQAVLLLRYIH